MKILVIVLVFLFVAPLVSAEDFPKAGITPDSKLYGLDRALERLNFALSFDRTKKAEKRLIVASERIAELQVMIQNRHTQYVDDLMRESAQQMELAEDEVLRQIRAGKDVIDLERRIAVASYNQVLVLESILKSVPLAGQGGLKIAIEQKTMTNQRALSRVERDTGMPAGVKEDLAKRRLQKA